VRSWLAVASWLGVGIAAGVLKLVAMFFPFSYLTDVVLFGLLGFAVGRRQPLKKYRFASIMLVPTMLLIAAMLSAASLDNLKKGVGIAWVYSGPLILGATFLGALIGGSRRRRS